MIRVGVFFVMAMMVGGGTVWRFEFRDFSTAGEVVLFSGADCSEGKLGITSFGKHQFGSAWYRDKQAVGKSFQTVFEFRVRIAEGAERTDGEGFAFVIQNNRITGLVGSPRSHYEIPNSVAIEFDTFCTPQAGDPNGNHISIQSRGELPNSNKHTASLGLTAGIGALADGKVHRVKIDYRQERLRVFLDQKSEPVLAADVNLSGLLHLDEGRAWVGFTGGTRKVGTRYEILDWSFKIEDLKPSDAVLSPTTKPINKDFKGEMILIELGDPLEDDEQLKTLQSALKRASKESALLLWIDSPGGQTDLVRQMSQMIESFTGPKIMLAGGGRYGGVYGQCTTLISLFDRVFLVPEAVIDKKWNGRFKTRKDILLVSSDIDEKRLVTLGNQTVEELQRLDHIELAKNPVDAVVRAGLNPEEVKLLPGIVLVSKIDEKKKAVESLLDKLPELLQKSVASPPFWNQMNSKSKSVSKRSLAASLEEYQQSARRSELIVRKILDLLESSPQTAKFITTEGWITQEWREDYFVHHRVKSKSPGKVRRKGGIRIELYYGGDIEKLKTTLAWLESAGFNYKQIRNRMDQRR